MRVGLATIFTAWTVLATSGCASVMSSGPREVPIASQPPGAKVSIYNRSGALVTSQTAPFVALLSPKHRYFQGQRYRVVFEKEGYEPAEAQLKARVGPWYLGNLLLGGPVGFLIIDPATGAMYRLEPDEIEQTLTPLPSTSTPASE
jgi:hypothetical protein